MPVKKEEKFEEKPPKEPHFYEATEEVGEKEDTEDSTKASIRSERRSGM